MEMETQTLWVWRQNLGLWFVRDFFDDHIAFPWGLPGDVPVVYNPAGGTSDVAVVRTVGTQYNWLFRGLGLATEDDTRLHNLEFGLFGDNILPGPWETPGVTSPAVARLYLGGWTFFIYQRDGSIRAVPWGGTGDIPRPSDYDGDGLFDVAVFRPTEQKTYVIRSSDLRVNIYDFGTGTADFTPRGDYTGDGIDDIVLWEPVTGTFQTLTSDNGFDDLAARNRNPAHYEDMQLGLYFVHLPLSWNRINGLIHYTVVDHQSGLRFIREGNNPDNPPLSLQWGLPGDAQG